MPNLAAFVCLGPATLSVRLYIGSWAETLGLDAIHPELRALGMADCEEFAARASLYLSLLRVYYRCLRCRSR